MTISKAMILMLLVLLCGCVTVGCGVQHLPDDPTTEPPATGTIAVPNGAWSVPVLNATQVTALRQKYPNVDLKSVVPQKLLDKALAFYDANYDKIANSVYIGIVDFSVHSSKPRFYIVGLHNSSVTVIHVAHGTGSDPSNSGLPTKFSNIEGSHMSSLGFYLTAEAIQHNGTARKLDGLSSTNSAARSRAIWLHSASYVVEKNVQPGRSWGCLAIATVERDWLMATLFKGSLIYAGQSAKE